MILGGTVAHKENAMPETHAVLSLPTKILLPVDFSPSSQTAFEMASDLAQHFHAALHLVHVIPVFPTTSISDLEIEVHFIQKATESAKKRLEDYHAALLKKGVESTFSIESGNNIVDNIMNVIEREHVDMVVISTHGVSGWHPLFFGSIAEKVIRLVQCPLLLLRTAKTED
jgi:nucleotide-binding universal stress UspA family protein